VWLESLFEILLGHLRQDSRFLFLAIHT
jgi:hypothetical protein